MTGRYQHYQEHKDSKQSWCGLIPAEWDFRRTKFLFQIKKRIAGELGHDVLSITQKGIKVKDTESGDGQLSMDYSKYQLVNVGDFAMNHMDLLTGYVDISNFSGVTSPDYRVFCSRDSSCIARYFLYLYQLAYIKGFFFPLGQGSAHLGRWRLPTEEFNGFRWPVPSRREQEQIANFLDHETAKIDTLIDKHQQLIKLLKEKRQAVISHAITKGLNPAAPLKDSGVEWLGEVPEHWSTVRIKQIASFITSGPRGWSDFICEEGEDIFLQSGDLNNELEILPHKAKRVIAPKGAEGVRTKLIEGDVVVCITGANTGRVAVVQNLTTTTYINQHLSLIRPIEDKVDAMFIGYALSSQGGRAYFDVTQYGLKEGLSLSNVAEAPLPLPPLNEQKNIVKDLHARLSVFSRINEVAENQVELLKERRTALISAAVTGKIDVRNWQPAEIKISMEASA